MAGIRTIGVNIRFRIPVPVKALIAIMRIPTGLWTVVIPRNDYRSGMG